MKKIGYFCSYLPKEVLYAFGFLPVRLLPTIEHTGPAEEYLPKNFCSLVKAILASVLEGEGQGLEGVAFVNSCDAYRRLYDVWREFIDVEIFGFLDVPRRNTPAATRQFARILRLWVDQLEGWCGQPLTAEALRTSIGIYNRQRELWQEIQSCWARRQIPTETYLTLRRALLREDPLETSRKLSEALENLSSHISPHSQGDKRGDGPRLMLLGSLLVKEKMFEAIERAGGRVVAEDSCAASRELRGKVLESKELEEMLYDLAAKYLSKPPCSRMRDMPTRLADISARLKEGQAEGVVCSYFKFCDLFLAEYPLIRAELAEWGYPVLFLEDEGETSLSGQARTRMEAFIELLT